MPFRNLRSELRVALRFALFGFLWIIFTDHLLAALTTDTTTLTALQTYKGWAFVLFSSLLIFLFMRSELAARTRAEKSLGESHAFNQALIQTIPFGISIIDEQGKVLYTNSALEKSVGMQGIGDYCWNLHREDRHQCSHCPLNQPIQIGETKSMESNSALDGKTVEISYTGMMYQGRKAILEIFYDITARKEAEAQLSLLASALQSTANAIVITDRDGMIEWANPAFASMTGYTREESLEHNPRDLVRSGIHDNAFYRNLWDTILAGQVWRGEIINRRKDGTLYNEEQTVTPVRAQDGTITHLVAVKQDITERKRVEEALRIKDYGIQSAINPVAMADLGGNLTYVNSAFLKIWGYADESDVLGRPAVDFWQIREHAEEIVAALQQVGGWVGELTAQRKDGSLFDVQISASMISNGEGHPLCMQAWFVDITERKRAEDALRRSEALLNQTGKVAQVGGWEIDLQTRTLAWSSEMYRIRELDPATYQPTLEGSLDFYTPEARPIITEAVSRGIDEGIPWDLELPALTATGRPFWVRIVGQAEFRDGKYVRLFGTLQDITERKEREHELETIAAINAALRPAVRRAEIVSAILNQLLVLLEVDGAALETYEPESGDLIAELGLGIWKPRTGLSILPGTGLSAHIISTGQPYLDNEADRDPRLLRPDIFGECQAVACVPVTLGNQLLGLLWIASRRRLNDHDLRLLTTVADLAASAIRRGTLYEQTESHAEQIDQLLRSVPDGVLLLDEGMRLVQANPAGKNCLAQLGGIQVGDLLVRLGDRSLDDLLTSSPNGGWHEIRQKPHLFEALARPLVAGPTTKGWVLVLRNVTRQREAQEHLQRQERLAAVGQLAAGIAHDFNNLMGVIILYVELLGMMPGLSTKNQERLTVIHQQARHASNLIEQILDFSRRSVIESQPLDLKPLVKEQVKLLQRTLPENVDIILTHDDAEHIVLVDPTRIQQMLMNLAINARDAMPDGGSLTIDLARLRVERDQAQQLHGVAPGDWICLTVSDTGMGVAPDVLEHIFEPFFTTKEPGRGTGLGLAQVYGIVGQHGGQIDVQSKMGAYTTFTIYLPALSAAPQEAGDAPENLPQGNGELLLVVEDNASLLKALAEYLQMWNYRSCTASNGEEALALLNAQSEMPALVLSDVVMPRMGGVAFLRSLRRRDYTMPVILLSGHPLDATEMQPLAEQGMVAWLSKPLDMAELARTIAHALG